MQPCESEQLSFKKRCLLCGDRFIPLRRTQAYCQRACRRRAIRLRKRERALQPRAVPLPTLDAGVLVQDFQQQHEALRIPPPQLDTYLAAYARVLEAEEQLRRWTRRLVERRRELADLPEPTLQAHRHTIDAGDAVALPLGATHVGAASTTGDLAIVLVAYGNSARS